MNTGLTADEIKDIAHNGRGNMPPGLWTGSDEDLQKLAEFIESLKAE
ncbi:menaquinol-cytochrome c reductase cytochrome b/c subunit [Bacillus sp. B14905]|nr:menaquinol-cytochrome c reductase cytochrome b/c subunit [Bacillus sp. B14905]